MNRAACWRPATTPRHRTRRPTDRKDEWDGMDYRKAIDSILTLIEEKHDQRIMKLIYTIVRSIYMDGK